MLDHRFLKYWLFYNRTSGVWVWRRNTRWTKAMARADRSRRRKDLPDYVIRTVCIKKRKYHAHRLAWFYVTKQWPPHGVDHKDGDPSNNRWNNLRLAKQSQNCANSKLSKTNTSGYKGVYWNRDRKKWQAYITFAGKSFALGRFKKIEDAISIRRASAEKLFGEFARHA